MRSVGGTVFIVVVNPYNQSVFAELIERARRNRGLTQVELGDVAGVGQQAVGKWEKGLTRPKPASIPAVAKALGVESRVLLVEAGYLAGEKPDPLQVEQVLDGGGTTTITIGREPPSLFEDVRPAVDEALVDDSPADDRLTSLEDRMSRLEALLEAAVRHQGPPGDRK